MTANCIPGYQSWVLQSAVTSIEMRGSHPASSGSVCYCLQRQKKGKKKKKDDSNIRLSNQTTHYLYQQGVKRQAAPREDCQVSLSK